MIARTWTARATRAGAEAYAAFFEGTIVPQLERLEGQRGALLLTRDSIEPGATEVTVLTFWDSFDAIAAFAGSSLERAVVEPEARALLTSFDEAVRHHDVTVDSR
jgi:heme-degrading monooxygenase HmoA